jgi:anthranilate synthase component 2
MNKLLVIDNYDSFTYNLVQMFRQYALEIQVHRSDMITLRQIETLSPDYVLISPGPKDPAHAGISIPLIKAFGRQIPILGVCLGMQCMNEAFGGKTVRAPVPMHGKTSMIHHNNDGIFDGICSPFSATRYHSLMVAFNQSALNVTARSLEGVIMGMSHPEYPLHGVQFHPESFLTENGYLLVENFLRLGPLAVSDSGMRSADGIFLDSVKSPDSRDTVLIQPQRGFPDRVLMK